MRRRFSRRGTRLKPPPRYSGRSAIPNGSGFCCGLADSRACVSELADDEGEKITTLSARLKILSAARLVRRRREAKHVFYTLADQHVLPLIRNAIDHAAESRTGVSAGLGHRKDPL